MHIYGKKAQNLDLATFVDTLQNGPQLADFGLQPGLGMAGLIHQGQAGFSATTPIGTEHVGQCVAVVARDPKTHATGVAHVDVMTDPRSIATMLERVSENPLEIILFGARYPHGSDAADLVDSGGYNLAKIMKVLASRSDHIVAAQVMDVMSYEREIAGQQNAWKTRIFIDPASGSISQYQHVQADSNGNLPFAYPDPNVGLRHAKMLLSGNKFGMLPMDTAFDMRRSPDRCPVFLREAETSTLNNIVRNGTDESIADWCVTTREMTAGGDWIGNCVNKFKEWNTIYQADLERTAKAMKKTPDELRQGPLYIGHGAVAANKEMWTSSGAPKPILQP